MSSVVTSHIVPPGCLTASGAPPSLGREPKLHFGLIMTGEKLIDNVDYRNQLKQFEPEGIGGEMEGAGLYVACRDSNVDWIMVKAICDWADGTKGGPDKDAYQTTAAQNAALFVMHALQQAPLKLDRDIEQLEKPDLFYCYYLICRDFDTLKEIVNRDLTRIPVKDPVLVENEPFEFLSALVREEEEGRRQNQFYGETFPTRDDYLQKHPDAFAPGHGKGRHEFYELMRIPTSEELSERWAPGRALLRRLLKTGAQPSDVSIIGSYSGELGCGDPSYQEVLITRPLWAAFIVAENIHASPLKIKAIDVSPDPGPPGQFRPFCPSRTNNCEVNLPAAPLRQGMSVIIPLGIVLGPLHTVDIKFWSETETTIDLAIIQTLSHCGVYPNDRTAHALLGPFLWPLGFRVIGAGIERYQRVHELDLMNIYTLDRHWQMGSCPHVFLASSISGKICYVSSLLAAGQGKTTTDSFFVHDGYDTALIAEIEEETTYLEGVWVGNIYFSLNYKPQQRASISTPG